MSKLARLIIGLVILLVAYNPQPVFNAIKAIKEIAEKDTSPDNSTKRPEPVEAPMGPYKERVQEILEFNIESDDKDSLVTFYNGLENLLSLMWVVGDPQVETTAQFRQYYITSASLDTKFWIFRAVPEPTAKLSGKYPGLADVIDSVIMDSLGNENTKITDDQKTDILATLRAIAWAVQQ